MTRRVWASVLVAACVAVSCGGAPVSGTAIGPSGGIVQGEGARLSVPQGALTQSVNFAISAVANPPSLDAGTWLGKVIRIESGGAQLASPATLTLEWSKEKAPDAGSASVTVYTAPSGGTAAQFIPLATKVVDATHVSVEVTHFSDFGPILQHAVPNTCNQTFCQQAGTECLYCEFPMCVPPGSMCCGASFCTPEAGACISCNGQPACGQC